MTSPEGAGGATAPAEEARAETRRVVDRLRTLSQAQLLAAAPPYASRAEAARSLAQALADAAAALESPGHVVRREVPDIGPFAVGDQVAVTAHDLLLAAATADGEAAARALAGAVERLRAVRRIL